MIGDPAAEGVGIAVVELGLFLHDNKIDGFIVDDLILHHLHIITDLDLEPGIIHREEIIHLDVIIHDFNIIGKDRDRNGRRRRRSIRRNRNDINLLNDGGIGDQGCDRTFRGRIRECAQHGEEGTDQSDFRKENPFVLQRCLGGFLGFHNAVCFGFCKGTPPPGPNPNFQASKKSRNRFLTY